MATPKPTVKPNEVRFAYLLLHYLHANVNNAYLFLAVVAWIRAEGGATGRYAGNNPLNLLLKGRRAAFRTLGAAAQATAKAILQGPQYNLILRIVRRGASGADEKGKQAMDLLQALAMSDWDKNHYGAGHWIVAMHDPEDPSRGLHFVFDFAKNTLLAAWMKLLGAKVTIPSDVLPQPVQPKPAPKVRVRTPDTHVPTAQQLAYIQPYAAQTFLNERWQPLMPLGRV